jgi:hypothetical protein
VQAASLSSGCQCLCVYLQAWARKHPQAAGGHPSAVCLSLSCHVPMCLSTGGGPEGTPKPLAPLGRYDFVYVEGHNFKSPTGADHYLAGKGCWEVQTASRKPIGYTWSCLARSIGHFLLPKTQSALEMGTLQCVM